MGCGCSSAPGVASDVPNIISSTVPEELVPEEESFFTYITKLETERAALNTLKRSKKSGGRGKLTKEPKLRLEKLQTLLKVM